MTNTLIALSVLIVVFIIGCTLRTVVKRLTIPVADVKAGKLNEHMGMHVNKRFGISPFESFYYNDKKINPRNYIVAQVDGECMVTRGIYPGNLIFVEKLNDSQKSFQKGDILYIAYNKKGQNGVKIREYESKCLDTPAVNTICYSLDGTIIPSSEKHKLDDIIGIVRYNFAI